MLIQARSFKDIAQGLFPPAALDSSPATQGRGQLAGLRLGRGRRLHKISDLLLEAARLLGPDLLDRRHLFLEFCQGFGDRLKLGLQPGLGQLFAIVEGLVGPFQHLLGNG